MPTSAECVGNARRIPKVGRSIDLDPERTVISRRRDQVSSYGSGPADHLTAHRRTLILAGPGEVVRRSKPVIGTSWRMAKAHIRIRSEWRHRCARIILDGIESML